MTLSLSECSKRFCVPTGTRLSTPPRRWPVWGCRTAASFDLVLLDLDLPDLDGKVVATTLRARPALQKVPIIAVSAQDQPTTQRLVQAYGCNGFIPKPIDTRTFPDQITAFLDRH